MESDKPDIKHALQAFHKITRFGEQVGQRYYLDGYFAWSDVDGYTLQIGDGRVNLWIYFHHKHRTDHPSRSDLDAFWSGLHRLAAREFL
ncbi:DUF3081 family protein [Marinobacterium jannaschii]|uniref:DUF3081 family protein n=1 Tax=Marinobacterium jannaschii TaxID=64970 RepID=UPI000481BBDE|nr:DUF3081 family protein [Marinobacterium jannaschii]